MRGLKRIVSAGIFLAGILGIIYPAFIDSGQNRGHPPGVTQTLIALFIEPQASLGYAMRVLCLLLVLATGYILISTRRFKNVPVTVVRTNVEVNFESNYSKGIIRRTQVIRANQEGVTAYFAKILTSATTGYIDRETVTMSVYNKDRSFDDSFHLIGTEKSLEIIHEFGQALPYAWYMPLLPLSALRKDTKDMNPSLRKMLVIRKQEAAYYNEYNCKHPILKFTAGPYPQHNINLRIMFTNKVPISLKMRRIKNNSVIDENYEIIGECEARVHLDVLEKESLYVSWINP